MRTSLRVATAIMLAVPALGAQGNLSTLGFGYPTGQLSTRALGTGGALGELDANSPLNPATLVLAMRSVVYGQYDPEFRAVQQGSRSANTTTARFPVFGVSGRIARVTAGLSFSNWLDRTWTNFYEDSQTVGGQLLPSRVSAQSQGGISDVRALAAYSLSDKVHVGLGLHVFPGEMRTAIGRSFPDSLKMGDFSQASSFNFSGSAVSVGVMAMPSPTWRLAATARVGGTMKIRQGDSTTVGRATVPTRLALSAAYEGYAGSSLVARYVRESWSSLRGLGTVGLPVHDATEYGIGAEIAGPKWGGAPMPFRLGWRSRDLPFSLGEAVVKETSLTGGVGVPLVGGRGSVDVSVARARRSAGDARETGWILSLGFGIRP